MGEIPSNWLDKAAEHARQGLKRLNDKRQTDQAVMALRSAHKDAPFKQWRPSCPSCWAELDDKQFEIFNGARRTYQLHFGCRKCNHVFTVKPA